MKKLDSRVNDLSNIFIDFVIKNYSKIFLITVTLFALLIRIYFVPWISGDYSNDLQHWFKVFTDNGTSGFKYIFDIANYPSLYLIIMALTSYLPEFSIESYQNLSTIFYVKLPSIIIDFVTAFFVYKFVYEYTKKKYISYIAYTIFLFLPTVIFNGALWAQIDAIYTSFIIISLFYLYKDKYLKSFLFYGVSFAFKTQAILIFPLFILLYFNKRFSFKYFLLIPFPHIIASFIAFLFGANFLQALKVSGGQRVMSLSNSAPSLPYLFFGTQSTNIIKLEQFYKFMFLAFFISITILACAVFLYIILNSKNKMTLDRYILWALVISFSMPFILPSMHERFFYMAEVISLIFAFMRPKYSYIAILINLCSLSTYMSYLIGVPILGLKNISIIMFVIFCLIMRVLYIESRQNKSSASSE